MNTWKDRLTGWFARPSASPPEAKQSAAGRYIAWHSLGQPVWTPRNYKALARQGFSENAVGYRCVRMIAEAAASVPWLIHDGEQDQPDHPLARLLARPNPVETGRSLMEAFYGHLLIAGNAYLEAVEVDGVVRELYALRPDRMKVVPGERGWPKAYEYTVNAHVVSFDMTGQGTPPILHERLFAPGDDHYGLSPLVPAARGIDIHNAAGAWNKALLDNAARPSGALIYSAGDGSASLSDEQFDRLKRELEASYQGALNAGRPLVLEGGLDWKPLAHSPRDMQHIDSRHVAARDIALAFGVPPMLLGIPGDNTFANYAEANRTFWRQTVLPLVTRTCQALTNWLAPAHGEAVRIGCDTDAVEALSGERDMLWRRLERAGFLTINEKRAVIGYAPLEDGDRLAGADREQRR